MYYCCYKHKQNPCWSHPNKKSFTHEKYLSAVALNHWSFHWINNYFNFCFINHTIMNFIFFFSFHITVSHLNWVNQVWYCVRLLINYKVPNLYKPYKNHLQYYASAVSVSILFGAFVPRNLLIRSITKFFFQITYLIFSQKLQKSIIFKK